MPDNTTKIYIVGDKQILTLKEYEEEHGSLAHRLIVGESMRRGVLPFDFMEARGHVCFKGDEHLKRFYGGLEKCKINIPAQADQLNSFIGEALDDAGFAESFLRVSVIMGDEGDSEPFLTTIEIDPRFSTRPLFLATYPYLRQHPEIKIGGDYYISQIAKRELTEEWKRSPDEVLYHQPGVIHQNNRIITEGSRCDFLAVKYGGGKNYLYGALPSKKILNGITRQTLLDILQRNKAKIPFDPELCGELPLAEIGNIDEAMVMSTTKRITPVARIDGHILIESLTGKPNEYAKGDRSGGPVTAFFSKLFNEYVEEYYSKGV
jgi:branched-subunit amino acid aminotransferase/4-amino-4-deoxychorismate lyase